MCRGLCGTVADRFLSGLPACIFHVGNSSAGLRDASLRRAGTDAVEARVYYPLPGTKAHELCHENGWLSGRDASAYFAGQSVLDMPGLDAQTIKRYATLLPHMVRHPKAWPTLMKLERIHLGRRSLADLVALLLGQRWSRR